MADFWDQFPLADQQQGAGGISAPTSPIANTGINGGNMGGTVTPVDLTQYGKMPVPSPAAPGGLPAIPPSGGAAFGGGVNTGASGQVQPSGTASASGYGTGPSMSGGGKDAFGQAWLASGGKTVDDLKAFVAAHPEYGVKLGGSKGDKVYGPNGEFWADAIESAGINGGIRGLWSTETGGGAGGAGGAGSGLAGLGYGFGSSMAPWTEQFGAPDPNTIANDPYYKFQMSEGMNALQNSAAARGTLLSGGFAKQAEQYGQGLASSFGDKAYDRGMNEYLLRRDNAFQNQDRPFSKSLDLAKLGRPGAA